MTTTADLLASISAHLAEFELPAIASVHAAASISVAQVTVQLTCHQPSAIAQGLGWPGPTPSPRSPPKPGASPGVTRCISR